MSDKSGAFSRHNDIDITIGNTLINITFATDNSKPVELIDSARHMHLFHEIHYIKCGASCIENDSNEKFYLKSEDICIIPSGVYHSVCLLSQPFERVCIFFDISKKDGADCDTYSCFSKIFSTDKIKILTNTLPYWDKICSLFSEIDIVDSIIKEKLKHLTSLIFIDFYEKNRENVYLETEETLKYSGEIRLKIEEFLSESPINQLKLENLADTLHLSTRQTDRLIKKYTGQCFRDIVVGIKTETAKELIATSQLSFKIIAEQVGYSSYSGFCNSFKKVTGITPQKYKQKLPH